MDSHSRAYFLGAAVWPTGLSNLSTMVGRTDFIFGMVGQYAISATIKVMFECKYCNCNVAWSMCVVSDFVYMLIAMLYSHAISMAANTVHANNTHYNRRKSLATVTVCQTKSQTVNRCKLSLWHILHMAHTICLNRKLRKSGFSC